MKKGLFHKSLIITVSVLAVVITSTWSCRKKDQTCHAIVTVIDTAGAPVAGASVRLHATPVSGQVEATETTDGGGKANFSFKLQAIFNVDATSGSAMGSGIIKLEPGETVEKTILIQ